MKYDSGKLMFTCLTRGLAFALRSVAAVLTYGALKYKPDSWKTIPDAKRRYEDALDRHLNAWKAGEGVDDESHMDHLAHAACNMLFLLQLEIDSMRDNGAHLGQYFEFRDPRTEGRPSAKQPIMQYREELQNETN